MTKGEKDANLKLTINYNGAKMRIEFDGELATEIMDHITNKFLNKEEKTEIED